MTPPVTNAAPCEAAQFAASRVLAGGGVLAGRRVQRGDRRPVYALFLAGPHDVGQVGEVQALLAGDGVVTAVDDLREAGETGGHGPDERGRAAGEVRRGHAGRA